MATGTVKWFSSEKGYGFISQEGGPDVFVHYKAIQGQGYRTLEENEPVEFDVQESPKGPSSRERGPHGYESRRIGLGGTAAYLHGLREFLEAAGCP